MLHSKSQERAFFLFRLSELDKSCLVLGRRAPKVLMAEMLYLLVNVANRSHFGLGRGLAIRHIRFEYVQDLDLYLGLSKVRFQ